LNLDRRGFLSTIAVAFPALALEIRKPQTYHMDSLTNPPGMEYYFLGNGLLTAALQVVADSAQGTHCGLILRSPDHFGRKTTSFLYTDNQGLSDSRVEVLVDDKVCVPMPENSEVTWEYPQRVPTVAIAWKAGACAITQKLFCAGDRAALYQVIDCENLGAAPAHVQARLRLLPNRGYFDEISIDPERNIVLAEGYHRLQVFSLTAATAKGRALTLDFGKLPPGASASGTIVLSVDEKAEELQGISLPEALSGAAAYWRQTSSFSAGHRGVDHLFAVSQSGIRSVAGRSGRMDAGPFQYNGEWGRDNSLSACGAVMAGMPEVSRAVLEHLLTKFVDQDGRIGEGGHIPPDTMLELDQNGELLHSIWTHWVWTGEDDLFRSRWQKVRSIADSALRPVFRNPKTGLMHNTREFWERWWDHGVLDGYELSYQVWNVVGLGKAAELAAHMGDREAEARWLEAASQIRTSLFDPRTGLVADGRFIKRRTVSGGVQWLLKPRNPKNYPPSMPLAYEPSPKCDPDATLAFPMMFELTDPKGELAANTFAAIEQLWNQRWDTGGYGRYDVTSEPDSPGAWPFATMYITRAYLEAGNYEKVWRALNWMLNVQGGRSGSWFEFYGERPTPPLVPVGVIVTTWGEILALLVHHLLGVRPAPSELIVRPRLLPGVDRMQADLRLNGHRLQLAVERGRSGPSAAVEGKTVPMSSGVLRMPKPQADIRIDLQV